MYESLTKYLDVFKECDFGRAVMALIVASMRGERFCDGFLLRLLNEGCVVKWLKRLDEIDGNEQASNRQTI